MNSIYQNRPVEAPADSRRLQRLAETAVFVTLKQQYGRPVNSKIWAWSSRAIFQASPSAREDREIRPKQPQFPPFQRILSPDTDPDAFRDEIKFPGEAHSPYSSVSRSNLLMIHGPVLLSAPCAPHVRISAGARLSNHLPDPFLQTGLELVNSILLQLQLASLEHNDVSALGFIHSCRAAVLGFMFCPSTAAVIIAL